MNPPTRKQKATHRTRTRWPFLTALGLACLVLQGVAAQTPDEPLVVTGVRPLLVTALQRGQARGILGGPGADYVRRRFDASSPIEIEVRRLRTLPQDGCARLEVITRQSSVLVNAKRSDQALAYQLNFCIDGNFPKGP